MQRLEEGRIPYLESLRKRQSLLSKPLLDNGCNAYILLRVNQGLNPFCEKEWLKITGRTRGLSRYLIMMENSKLVCYLTDCFGTLWGSHFRADRVGQGVGHTPTILNSEIYRL